MDLTYLFRRLVFTQVLMGVLAFCMAELKPELLLLAGTLTALSWYVVEGPTGRPLPQGIILLGALGAVAALVAELWYFGHADAVVAVGHFTMWLQVVQLYARKTNRDYALLLVLSLLQMVGATVLPGGMSVAFGGLMVVYCGLALFTVLVFQFKATSDLVLETAQAAAPPGASVQRPAAVLGAGYRWQFRLMAAAIALVCALVSILAFLLLPRGAPLLSGDLGSGSAASSRVGFSESVDLGAPPPRSDNREPVLHVSFRTVGGEALPPASAPWLLRGIALDRYDPTRRTWSRSETVARFDAPVPISGAGRSLADDLPPGGFVEASLTLRGSAQKALFSPFPTVHLQSGSFATALFNSEDQQLSLAEAPSGVVTYRVRQPLVWGAGLFEAFRRTAPPAPPAPRRWEDTWNADAYARTWTVSAPPIRRLAEQIIEQAGLRRDPAAAADPDDRRTVAALRDYLRANFTYSLTPPRPGPRQEPISEFLFRQRQGHCELFASALAALCRSVGIRARVVNGYVAREYNSIGGYYVVRQNNAHSWVEAWCPDGGWVAFDATPPAALEAEHQVARSWLTPLRQLYEHLEFAWLSTFMTYNRETRDAVLERLRTPLAGEGGGPLGWLRALRNALQSLELDALGYGLVLILSAFVLLGLAILVRLWVRRRQRLAALQLTRLPHRQRRRLVRRLGFYLAMLDMLERHGFRRPAWQSPFAFAQELAGRDALRFEPVVSLTEHFYEIRFGHREVDLRRKRTIRVHLRRLEETLAQSR